MTFWRQLESWFHDEQHARRDLAASGSRAALLGEMPILAAGTALYAIIATVPALAAVVSVFGIVADAPTIQSHLKGLQTVMPQEVVQFIGSQLERQAERSGGELSFQLVTGLLAATIWRGAGRGR